MDTQALVEQSKASAVHLIDYDHAQVVPGFVNDTYFLIVAGQAPCLNMKVELSPYIYIQCPEYWGIEVTAILSGRECLTAVQPFLLVMDLTHMIGSQGIEVIGATKSKKFELPGGCTSGHTFA